VRLEGIANCLVLATAVACVWWRVGSSATGLVIGYALSMAGALNWLVRQVAETEANIIAAERLSQYAALPQEEDPAAVSDRLQDVPEAWPAAGAIRFDGVSLRYRPELPTVLKDLSLDIRPGERIGIVGRTGAGKSSLISCLFRLTPLETGTITIDGLDTKQVPLHRLRRSIAIIPQDPVLFAGTMRSNLDPTSSHSDAELWQALRLAHLSDHVASMAGGLDALVGEGGEGLSVGQRQLLCLARAILRRARVVVLDEATASIDQATDALIQQSIRSDFGGQGGSTLLTIAHRLSTVLDYDRIMVLDGGRLAEFDTPERLMADPASILSALLRETSNH
jgi:ABC-type multidrug transport system fused ATPase/permease subunit